LIAFRRWPSGALPCIQAA
jgi:hypothetical protein